MKAEPTIKRVKKLPGAMRAVTVPPYGILIEGGVHPSIYWGVLNHERIHWEQYLRLGSAVRFYLVYGWMWLRYGYGRHPMEIEARERAGIR